MKNPFVQTVLARAAANYLETKLNTTLKIARLEFNPFRRISLNNVLIMDQQHDTLLYTKELKVGWKKLSLKNPGFELKSIFINNADIRLKKYKNTTDLNYSFILDYFSSGKELSTDSSQKEPSSLSFFLEKINIINCRFIFEDQNDTTTTEEINFSDIDLMIHNFETGNLSVNGDSIKADVRHLSFQEKSGFRVDSLSGKIIFCPSLLQAANLLVRTQNNDLNLDVIFAYGSMVSFNDFIHSVNIQANIRPSILNLYDVGYFAPILFELDNKTFVEGKISGTVDNFKTRDFKFSFGNETHFNGNIQMNGLPDFFETFIHLSIIDFNTSASDIVMFNLPIESNRIQLPEFLNKLGVININGKFTGFYNDFVSYGNFKSDLGQMNTDLLFKFKDKDNIEYKGNIATKDLRVGTIFEIETYLNNLTLKAEVKGHGLDFETMDLTANGVIQSIDFYNNNYKEIDISGNLRDKKFNGTVNINDELIKLGFKGIIDYSQMIPAYKFLAIVDSAQLNKMNLINKDSSIYLSTKINIDLSGNQFDNLLGIVQLDSTILIESGNSHIMNNFSLSFSRNGPDESKINLTSDLADLSMEGKFTFKDLPYFANKFINRYIDTVFVDLPANESIDNQDFSFELQFKNADPLTSLIIPQLKISKGTIIKGGYKSNEDDLFFDLGSDEISYKSISFCHLDVRVLVQNDDLIMKTSTGHLYVSDSLSFDSINCSFAAGRDSLFYDVNWNNRRWEAPNYGNLDGHILFYSPKDMVFQVDEGKIVVNDTVWEFEPASYISIDSSSLDFKNFGLKCTNQGMIVNGKISSDPADTLILKFDRFNLSNTDLFLKNSGIDLDGFLDGNLSIVNFYKTPNYLADMSISQLGFNKEKLGEAIIRSDWIPQNEAFNILAQIIYEGNVAKHTTLEVIGTYYPKKKNNNFDINIRLDNYKLHTLAPFIRDFSSKIEGLASGNLKLFGSTKEPELAGSLNIMRTNMKIDYLNVIYSLTGKINFDHNLISYDSVLIWDSLNNQAISNGKITHDYFRNFNLDLNFSAKNLSGLNTTRVQNETFYGTALASGNVSIYGPPSNLALKLEVKSEKGTNIKIPASYGSEIANNDFIVFIDTSKEIPDPELNYEVDIKGITLDLGLIITQDANIQLFLPYQMGNIQANGSGDIIMNINPAGEMSMKGDYIINRGSFFLTLQNIINRDFNIRRGSKVTWTGDPFNAQIDLKAVYKVKTSLGEYGPPEDSATRVHVDCVIALSKNLVNPEIKFTIEFPELKESDKQYIYSQLDTTDQAMMSQQMISLLLLNSFSYSSGSTGSVGFNTFSILTNQLNNYLSGISNNLDIGLNYRPGGQLSSDEVDLALSTRLFDDRVTIDGNVGVRGKENTSNLIGEVTVEVKITDDGRFRAKVFNKSNNDDLYKNYAPYTQGVGVFYTQDFHRFKDIFRRKEQNQ